MNELALFAGAGGGILGGLLCGFRTVCAVEWDAYARDVLVARQNDECLAPFPIWDDIQTFDGKPWRGCVEVVSGGFPCQDISTAGKGAGITGKRSGMWAQMRRVIGEVRPRYILVENSPALTTRGGVRVTADLAAMGYVGCNGVLGAADAIWSAGTPCADHLRDRIWFVGKDADSNSLRELQPQGGQQKQRGRTRHIREAMGNATGERWNEEQAADDLSGSQLPLEAGRSSGADGRPWWATEPDVGRVAHGVASRVDRMRCLGNGQVPAVVPLAWNLLSQMNSLY